jgi:hypothetical protein
MNELQPPDDLQQIWLAPQPEKEDIEMVVTKALLDSQSFRTRAKLIDIGLIAGYIILVPLCFLAVVIERVVYHSALVGWGYVAWSAMLLGGLIMFARAYRGLHREPSPTSSLGDYLHHSVEFLDRRERLLWKSAMPFSLAMAGTGVVFAFAVAKGEEGLFQLIVSLLYQPFSWWATLDMSRRYEKKRKVLRQILADLQSAPES